MNASYLVSETFWFCFNDTAINVTETMQHMSVPSSLDPATSFSPLILQASSLTSPTYIETRKVPGTMSLDGALSQVCPGVVAMG